MNKIQIYLHGEYSREPKLIEVPEKASVTEILQAYASAFPSADQSSEASVFLEDSEEPLSKEKRGDESGIKKKGHIHCHRCRKISVSIFYNGEDKPFHFSPSTTGKVILKRAIKAFNISEVDAGDYLLKLEDKTVLQPSDHIGSFASHPRCEVKLFLTPTKPVQG